MTHKSLFFVLIFSLLSINVYSQQISLEEVSKYLDTHDTVKVCGKIFTVQVLKTKKGSNITLLNLGAKYPEQLLTVVIYEEMLSALPPEVHLVPNSEICITGNIIAYKGKPEIVIKKAGQFAVTGTKPDTKKIVERKEIVAPTTGAKKDNTETVAQSVKLKKDMILRSGPGTDFPVITVVPSGSSLSVIYSNNGWSYVSIQSGLKTPEKIKGYMKVSAGN